jgi:uncharacterized protein (TIGR02594 family)
MSKWVSRIEDKGIRVLVEVGGADNEKFIRRVQTALRRLGKQLAIDGDIGPITVGALNGVEPEAFFGEMFDVLHPPKVALVDGVPEWIRLAVGEIGVKEIKGPKHNKRVIEYMNATKWGKWVKDDETPWCAGFVGWCMVNAGYIDDIPDYSLGAKSWLKFGVSAHKPVFGAIAVKSRKGGGHVGFVVGRNRKRGTLYILGGNQSDAVCVKEYPENVWLDFRIPEDYTPKRKLAVWRGASSLSGSEA